MSTEITTEVIIMTEKVGIPDGMTLLKTEEYRAITIPLPDRL
jgi:hypothetical protein